MKLLKRTDMCGELNIDSVNKEVVLNGWVQKRRDLGSLIFCDLRDKTGLVQIVFDEDIPREVFNKANELRSEFVIGIRGTVKERETKNPDMTTGEIEISASELEIYSIADTPPIYVKDDDNVDENLRLKYRYIDLRKHKMQKNLKFRSDVVRLTRDYFLENGFTEIETPVLIKPTPEGARDYLVPSRVNQSSFYALPQSPQMYKQLLMAGGADRYMQVAKCFRDEDLRADRQPEFTQIDLEMSFVDMDDVLAMQEGYMSRIFKDIMGINITIPFPRLTYKEAMERYGSDKPDTRFNMELTDITKQVAGSDFKVFSDTVKNGGYVQGINVKEGAGSYSRKDIDKLTEKVRSYGAKGLAWIKINDSEISSSFSKFFSEDEMKDLISSFDGKPNDLILIVADNKNVVYDSLGFLRVETAKSMGLIDNKSYDFLWVTDFPLLEYDEETKKYNAMHHPFTSPHRDDISLLDSEPENVRASAYDIVLNGVELGGGSIRIHDRDLQKKMFETLGLSSDEIEQKFGFLLEAFKYGVPPHGGLAYGLDRLIMILLGEDSIRESIAFPKNQNAIDMVSGAPGQVDDEQLSELGIKTERQK